MVEVVVGEALGRKWGIVIFYNDTVMIDLE